MTKVAIAKQLKRNDLQVSDDEYFSDDMELDAGLNNELGDKVLAENMFSQMKTFQKVEVFHEYGANGTFT